jgi:ribonuclease HI
MKLTINTDGGARGNPGPGAYGVVIANDIDDQVTKLSGYLGEVTNNQAEYLAVLKALEYLEANLDQYVDVTEAKFILDSELVVRQILQVYTIKNPELYLLYEKIVSIRDRLPFSFVFTHVKREHNKPADELVNIELDRRL